MGHCLLVCWHCFSSCCDVFVVNRMSGWSVSQFCQTAWCWRSSCVCPMMPCWALVWPADSGRLSLEMSSFGGSCSTAITAYHALYHGTPVQETKYSVAAAETPIRALCVYGVIRKVAAWNNSGSVFVQRLCRGTGSSGVCLTVSPVWRFRRWENTATKSSTWLSLTGVTASPPALKTALWR